MDVEKIKIAIDTGDLQRAKDMLDKVGNQAQKTDKSVGGLTSSFVSFRGAVAAVATSAVISNYIKMADTFTSIESKLKLATKSTNEFSTAQRELFNIAQESRVAFESTVDLYSKLAISTEQLKLKQSDLLRVTETINKSGLIGGGTKESINAALVQLGQGFASGTLRGEELNSVLEQTPRLAKAIAEGMGVTVGELRKLGEQGSITAEKVVNSLLKQSETIDKEFNKMTATVSQSMTVLENSTINAIGTIDKLTGASGIVAKAMMGWSWAIDEVNKSLKTTFGDVDKMNDVADLTAKRMELVKERMTVKNDKFIWDSDQREKISAIDKELMKVSLRLATLFGEQEKLSQTSSDATDELKQSATTQATNEKILIDLMDERSQKIAKIKKESADLRKEGGNIVLIAEREAKAIKDVNEQYDKKSLDEYTSKQKEQASALKDVNSAYLEMSRVGMSEYDKSLSEIQEKTKEWIAVTGNKAEALKREAILIAELNKKRDDESAKNALELEKQKNEQIDKRITSLNREYDLKEKQVGLIYDETERNQALTKLYYERRVQEIELEKQKHEQSNEYYESQLSYEKALLDQNLFRYSATGQIIESVSSGMKSSMMDFFDYTSAGFGDLKKMALDLGNMIYKAVTQQMVVNPLVGALSSAATSYFGGVGATVGSATASNNATLGISGADTNIQTGLPSSLTMNAKGGAYSSPSLSNYSNGVYSSPQVFAFAKGGTPNVGVFGEAGAEAIMPLTRDSNGSLGVKSVGGGNGVVKVEVINQTSGEVQVTNTKTRNDLEGTVLSIVINGINNNKMGLRTMIGGR